MALKHLLRQALRLKIQPDKRADEAADEVNLHKQGARPRRLT